jgi:hypothetical protein
MLYNLKCWAAKLRKSNGGEFHLIEFLLPFVGKFAVKQQKGVGHLIKEM